MNTVVALAIACFKAMIVVLYFMHVKYSTRLIKLTVIAGLYWMGILFVLTLSDYLTRAWGTFGQQVASAVKQTGNSRGEWDEGLTGGVRELFHVAHAEPL